MASWTSEEKDKTVRKLSSSIMSSSSRFAIKSYIKPQNNEKNQWENTNVPQSTTDTDLAKKHYARN